MSVNSMLGINYPKDLSYIIFTLYNLLNFDWKFDKKVYPYLMKEKYI